MIKGSKILKKRKYRGSDPSQQKPPEHELRPRADFELYKKNKEKKKEEKKQSPPKEKEPEEKPKEAEIQFKMPIAKEEDNLKILNPKPESKVKANIVELPSYEIKKIEGNSLKILVNLPSVPQMSEVELFVAENCVKILAKDTSEIKIPLKQAVDTSKVGAKFNKKKKVLTISLTII